MKITIKKQLNYMNEALLLATRICNTEASSDGGLPLDAKTVAAAKPGLNQKYEELVTFLRLVRTAARQRLMDFEELRLLFRYFRDEQRPELLYFLTYSYLEQSITAYSQEELLALVKAEFIENMTAQGYQLTEACSFDEIDRLVVFNEQQRYAIYKLLSNVNQIFDRFYGFLSLLEQVIREQEHLVSKHLNRVYEDLENPAVLAQQLTSLTSPLAATHDVESMTCTCLIQFQQLVASGTLVDGHQARAFAYIGLLPYLLQTGENAAEKKEEMFKAFALLSDATRFKILVLLAQEPKYGRELSGELSISAGTISHHLSQLLEAGLIVSQVKGKKIYYSINQHQLQKMGEFLLHLGGNNNVQ